MVYVRQVPQIKGIPDVKTVRDYMIMLIYADLIVGNFDTENGAAGMYCLSWKGRKWLDDSNSHESQE